MEPGITLQRFKVICHADKDDLTIDAIAHRRKGWREIGDTHICRDDTRKEPIYHAQLLFWPGLLKDLP